MLNVKKMWLLSNGVNRHTGDLQSLLNNYTVFGLKEQRQKAFDLWTTMGKESAEKITQWQTPAVSYRKGRLTQRVKPRAKRPIFKQ